MAEARRLTKAAGGVTPVRTSQSTRLVPEPSEPRRARIVDAFALGTHHKLITMIKRDPWRRLDHLPAAIELSQLAKHQYDGHEKEHETAPRSQRGTLLFGRPLDTPRFQTAGTAGALIRSRSLLGLAMPLRAGIRNNPRGLGVRFEGVEDFLGSLYETDFELTVELDSEISRWARRVWSGPEGDREWWRRMY
jgi:hypothetical protein